MGLACPRYIMAFTVDIQCAPYKSAAEADWNSAMRHGSSLAIIKIDHYIESNELGASKRLWTLSRQSGKLTIPGTYANGNYGSLLHGSDDVVGPGGSPPQSHFSSEYCIIVGIIAGAYIGVGLLGFLLKLGLLRFLLHHGQMRKGTSCNLRLDPREHRTQNAVLGLKRSHCWGLLLGPF
jgi:hypothetical protein